MALVIFVTMLGAAVLTSAVVTYMLNRPERRARKELERYDEWLSDLKADARGHQELGDHFATIVLDKLGELRSNRKALP